METVLGEADAAAAAEERRVSSGVAASTATREVAFRQVAVRNCVSFV